MQTSWAVSPSLTTGSSGSIVIVSPPTVRGTYMGGHTWVNVHGGELGKGSNIRRLPTIRYMYTINVYTPNSAMYVATLNDRMVVACDRLLSESLAKEI